MAFLTMQQVESTNRFVDDQLQTPAATSGARSRICRPQELRPILVSDAPREDVDRVARQAALELDAVEELVLRRDALEQPEVDKGVDLSSNVQ